jgi:hypothetical protein
MSCSNKELKKMMDSLFEIKNDKQYESIVKFYINMYADYKKSPDKKLFLRDTQKYIPQKINDFIGHCQFIKKPKLSDKFDSELIDYIQQPLNKDPNYHTKWLDNYLKKIATKNDRTRYSYATGGASVAGVAGIATAGAAGMAAILTQIAEALQTYNNANAWSEAAIKDLRDSFNAALAQNGNNINPQLLVLNERMKIASRNLEQYHDRVTELQNRKDNLLSEARNEYHNYPQLLHNIHMLPNSNEIVLTNNNSTNIPNFQQILNTTLYHQISDYTRMMNDLKANRLFSQGELSEITILVGELQERLQAQLDRDVQAVQQRGLIATVGCCVRSVFSRGNLGWVASAAAVGMLTVISNSETLMGGKKSKPKRKSRKICKSMKRRSCKSKGNSKRCSWNRNRKGTRKHKPYCSKKRTGKRKSRKSR